jgi:plastocyanin domain-containing protein
MSFNPYGPEQETVKQALRIHEVVKHKSLKTVCGYNYIANFADWMAGFERLIGI